MTQPPLPPDQPTSGPERGASARPSGGQRPLAATPAEELRRLHHELAETQQRLQQTQHEMWQALGEVQRIGVRLDRVTQLFGGAAAGPATPTRPDGQLPRAAGQPPQGFPAPGPAGVPHGQSGAPQSGSAPGPYRVPAGPAGGWAAPTGQPVPASAAVPGAVASWWKRESAVTRVLSVAGAFVTLAGLTMLLVLAVQNGWFGPVARVIAASVLAVVLIALALVVRRGEQRTGRRAAGSVGLMATGLTTVYLIAIMVSVVFDWVPPLTGLAIGALAAGAGVVFAQLWRSQVLALVIAIGGVVLGPVVADDATWTAAFLLVLALACWVVLREQEWPAVTLVTFLPATVAMMAAVDGQVATQKQGPLLPFRSTTAVVLMASLLVSTWVVAFFEHRRPKYGWVTAILPVLGLMPLLWELSLWDDTAGLVALSLVVAATLLAFAFVPRRRESTDWFGLGALIASVLAWYVLVAQIEPPSWRGGVLLLVAIGFFVAAVLLNRGELALPAGLISVGGLFYAVAAVGVVLERYVPNVIELALPLVLEGVLLIGWGLVCAWAVHRLQIKGVGTTGLVIAVGSALIGVMVLIIGLAALATRGSGESDVADALVAAHAVVSIVWMLIAAALLAFGLRRGRRADLGIRVGLVVAGTAVAKLFLYDLAALDGIWRGIAFVVVGLLLLGIGVGYAKALARAKAAETASGSGWSSSEGRAPVETTNPQHPRSSPPSQT